MDGEALGALVWVVVFIVVAVLFIRHRRRRGRIGGAGAGTVYDWLNRDGQHAVEMIAQGRAEARDPETRDGNLPELEEPRSPKAGAPGDTA